MYVENRGIANPVPAEFCSNRKRTHLNPLIKVESKIGVLEHGWNWSLQKRAGAGLDTPGSDT